MSFPRVYTSFAEFEREELRKLDSLRTSVDDLMEERFAQELDFSDDGAAPASVADALASNAIDLGAQPVDVQVDGYIRL